LLRQGASRFPAHWAALALLPLCPLLLAAGGDPVPVTVIADGASRAVLATGPTVGQALAQGGVTVAGADEVIPPASTSVIPRMAIRVVRVEKRRLEVPTTLPFRILVRPAWRQSRTTIAAPGRPGVGRKIVDVTLRDGKVVRSQVISRAVISPPVDRIVLRPTRPMQLASRGGFYGGVRVLTMVATAYHPMVCGTGRTRTGIRARHGVVAVDPRVIPLGTRLYIPGYGPALAADTGGAIRGRRIDLCMENRHAIRQFGRRRVSVHVLR
jgi:3D (Asp-Asp-Asp) domain-containing protein